MTASIASSLAPVPRDVAAVPEGKSPRLSYRAGELCVERVALRTVAEAVGTPCYCYSAAILRQAYADLAGALAPQGVAICFAVKANGNLGVLAEFARMGCGMDIVSGGELERALAAGVPANRIVFSGVGKTRDEIRRALAAGIHQINVESPAELAAVAAVARALGVVAPVALRVNPDVDAGTHAKITTARKGNKFGIDIDAAAALYAEAAALPDLNMVGLAVHIGSQIVNLAPFRRAWSAMAALVRDLRGRGLRVERLDLGGGLGTGVSDAGEPDLAEYAAIIAQTVGDLGCALTVEPGRWLSARAGVLLTEVLYLKDGADAQFAIVDAAMNDLIRPALYDARHPVLTVHAPRGEAATPCRVVGPICESSDDFGRFDDLGELRPGDLLAFDNAGAYAASMSSTYNARPLVPEVMVDGDRFRVIRRRFGTAEALGLEVPGPWNMDDAMP